MRQISQQLTPGPVDKQKGTIGRNTLYNITDIFENIEAYLLTFAQPALGFDAAGGFRVGQHHMGDLAEAVFYRYAGNIKVPS